MMKVRGIVFALIMALLTGCVAAVVAGAAAGLVVYDRRSLFMIENDTHIFHVIHTRLVTDLAFKNSRIVVSSFNRVVLLVGQTPSAELKMMAEKISRNTPSVRRVYNEISVDYPISMSEKAKDTWITSQVRTLMLAKKGLESGSIRVVTENGIVYLMGIVTHEQAELAVDVARQVEGVGKVVKVFQYIV